jgi:hypothetical protein
MTTKEKDTPEALDSQARCQTPHTTIHKKGVRYLRFKNSIPLLFSTDYDYIQNKIISHS